MADYGTDIDTLLPDGTVDLDPYFALVSGGEAVCQALSRRLLTPAGGMIGDDEYGFDLRKYCNASMSRADEQQAISGIEAQCLLDERVADVDVALEAEDGVLTVTIDGTLSDATSFRLVLAVSAVTTAVLEAG